MTDSALAPAAVPLLPVSDVEKAVAFWTACGFICSERQTRPSAYAVLRLGDTGVHLFGRKIVGPETAGIGRQPANGCRALSR